MFEVANRDVKHFEAFIMPSKKSESVVATDVITSMIYIVRGQRVMLDSDLAKLYGVTTFRLNEQVSRNRDRFPSDFAYQLDRQELANLISQNAISSSGHGGRRKLPWVFTEHGIAMLSGVLRSETAIRVNIEIIREFVRLRRLLATPGDFATQLQQLADTVKLHDDQVKVISQILQKMLAPPPPADDGRRIGFKTPSPTKE